MIDLHLHLDGSLTTEEILFLAKEQKIELPANNLAELRPLLVALENCKNLNEYLKRFDIPLQVLQTKIAIEYAVESLLVRLYQEKIKYAEIRFAPQLHMQKGLSQKEIVRAAISGMKKAQAVLANEISAQLILCLMRGKGNETENEETLKVAKYFLHAGVCAVDLAGAEALYPTAGYRNVFRQAQDMELPFTIHAGEADGAESIKNAIAFGAARIGHGVRAVEDDELMKILAETKIPLELCPTSNIQTRIFTDLREYPIRKFLERGICATINTDNKTVSDTSIREEFEKLKLAVNLTREEEITLLKNAAQASFLDAAAQERLIEFIK